MIEVLATNGLATVQDLGRDSHYRYGVSVGGAMDRLSLALSNAMLGNPDGAAAIEIPIFPFQVKFRTTTAFALTGADCEANLDDLPVLPNWVMTAEEGQVLTLNPPVAGAGAYAYLAVQGGIDVPEMLGSRSTHLRAGFGGYEGRTLQKGDTLKIRSLDASTPPLPPIPHSGFGAEAPRSALPSASVTVVSGENLTLLRVLPAAEYERFDEASQRLFWETTWRITPQSNRAGYRLSGPSLNLVESLEMRSHGIVPGVIQVPMGGSPIVQTADSQTAGGYPKIGTIIEADLWLLAQAGIGAHLQFVETTYGEAVAALETAQAYVNKVRFLSKTYRGFDR